MIHEDEFVWNDAERNRRLDVYRPCPCGTCSVCRRGVGYLSFSDDRGNGFTVWLQDEEVFDRLGAALNQLRKEHSEENEGSVSPARRKLRPPTVRAKRKTRTASTHKPVVID